MAKVAFIINSLTGGGAERVVARLANHMVGLGCEVHIYLLKDVRNYELDPKVICNILSGDTRQDKAVSLKRLMVEEENRGRYDIKIAFLHSSHDVARRSGVDGIYLSIRNYGSMALKGKGYLKFIRRRKQYKSVYDGARVLGVCQSVIDDLIQNLGANPSSCGVIYNPYDIEKIRALSNEACPKGAPEKFVLQVGSFHKSQKRQDIALRVLKRLPKDTHLVFLGDGKLRKDCSKLAKRMKLSDRVHFIGWDKNPFVWMRMAKMLLLTSDYEGFPNVVVESLIVGTPVVCRRGRSGVDEILEGELQEFVFSDRRLVKNLAAKATFLLEQDGLDESWNELIQDVVAKFSIDVISKKYLELAEQA